MTDGRLDLGPWEQIFYGEFDGKRRKRVLVKIIGDVRCSTFSEGEAAPSRKQRKRPREAVPPRFGLNRQDAEIAKGVRGNGEW